MEKIKKKRKIIYAGKYYKQLFIREKKTTDITQEKRTMDEGQREGEMSTHKTQLADTPQIISRVNVISNSTTATSIPESTSWL